MLTWTEAVWISARALATRYSIALPDMRQFRGLWDRLPKLAKERIGITAIFVSSDGSIIVLK
jgi:hypothetical protein